ncbi:MAG: putative Holliday junction resolvase [Verrucomicrobiales bacterium]|jgi:putative Holliday junction resolvase
MKRLLGIDFGQARIGVAGSDEIGLMAHPVETVHVREVQDPCARIAEICAQRRSEIVVVGMPFRMDGSAGTATQKVDAFIKKLRVALPDQIGIVSHDERLTTVEAQAHLHAAGRTVKNSRDVIDQAAAVVILQHYMDAHPDFD